MHNFCTKSWRAPYNHRAWMQHVSWFSLQQQTYKHPCATKALLCNTKPAIYAELKSRPNNTSTTTFHKWYQKFVIVITSIEMHLLTSGNAEQERCFTKDYPLNSSVVEQQLLSPLYKKDPLCTLFFNGIFLYFHWNVFFF